MLPSFCRRTNSFSPSQVLRIYEPDQNELAVAAWAFEHDQPAGRGTDTLPSAPLRCSTALIQRNKIIGVLGICPRDLNHFLSPQQRQTLAAFTNQAALAIERASLLWNGPVNPTIAGY